MARIRTIKPEFFRNKKLYEAEAESGLPLRVAFAGLWTAADREGRFKWKPDELKLDCLPWDDIDFVPVLNALEEIEAIRFYVVDGVEYGVIPAFKEHQLINAREAQSKIPEPPEATCNARALPSRVIVIDPGKGREGKGREKDSEAKASGAEAPVPETIEAKAYRVGKEILGKPSGGVVTKLRKHCRQDLQAVIDVLEESRARGDPMAWIQGVLRNSETTPLSHKQIFPDEIYQNVL